MDNALREKLFRQLKKADEKLNAAKKLLELRLLDDAVSRAYYAMFHAAKALLEADGLYSKTHSGLLTLFAQHFVKTGIIAKAFFDTLSSAKELRESGDYEAFFSAEAGETKEIVEQAEAFVNECKRILLSRLQDK
ncbi:MAG: HEPN domain-containing protein [Bacillota bacterium]